jgi:hypothetical protein
LQVGATSFKSLRSGHNVRDRPVEHQMSVYNVNIELLKLKRVRTHHLSLLVCHDD